MRWTRLRKLVLVGLGALPSLSLAGSGAAAPVFVPLGHLPGSDSSAAYAISGDGSVVVGLSVLDASTNRVEAFRWTADGGMVGLGDLPGGDFRSTAQGVSFDGSVIVGSSSGFTFGGEAYRWTADGGMVGLGGGQLGSSAWATSADGSVVVGRSSLEAFRWTADGGMVLLASISTVRDSANGGRFRGVTRSG
jgi:probable HAF family extracellular repeat protein